MKSASPKPFLKWAGGKGQLVSSLLAAAPKYFSAYAEPFLGGGALFFALVRERKLNSGYFSYLSDTNAELITTYKQVRDDVDGVIAQLRTFEFSASFYYDMRALDLKTLAPIRIAARMIYLNRAGFNGLYRVNLAGDFNVPWGNKPEGYKFSEDYFDNLKACSEALKECYVGNKSFREAMIYDLKKEGFVYCDPPYLPREQPSNFSAYTKEGFGYESHKLLARTALEVSTQYKASVLLSNADTSDARMLYNDVRFKVTSVEARRSINSDGANRGKVGELLISTY